jgi:predicted permease
MSTLEQLRKDLSYSVRTLLRDRSFTVTTVATLAVALSLVTVVFAIFNAYVLRPYAVRDPYSLFEIRWNARTADTWSGGRTFRWSDYEELRQRRDLFDDVIAERHRPVSSEGRRLLAAFVSGNYFDTLGGRALSGRALAAFDARSPGSEPVAVLSYDAWTRHYDRDPSVLGRTIRVNDQPLTIVGIMREEFVGLNDTPPDLWVPVTMHGPLLKQDLFGGRQPRELAMIARLRSGVTAEQVASALAPAMERLADRTGIVRAEILPQATPAPLTAELLARLSPVFAAFVLVLVAACANVSNVMLARASARQREIGIRLSLGAARWRIVRQLLTEGLLISALAGVAALGVANLVLRTGLAVFFLTLPTSFAAVARVLPLDLDRRVFLFTLIASAVATVMFALLPALQATRLTLTDALRGESSSGVRGSRLRSLLVVSQVAVSLVLIIVATTLVRNGSALKGTEIGFDTSAIVSITQQSQGENLIARAYDALSTDPHVARVAITSQNPLTSEMPKTPVRQPGAATLLPISYLFVSPEYFSTVQMPIVRGRGFEVDEARTEARVAIISAAAAQALWPGADPLGQTVRIWLAPDERPDVMSRNRLVSSGQVSDQGYDVTVIGLTPDAVTGLVYDGRTAQMYLPTSVSGPHAKALLARGRSVRDVRPDTLQEILRTVSPNPLAFSALSLDEALALQLYPLKVASWIGLLLSTIALVLSVSGLYGVVSYGLSQRTKEIGIRMALGATSTAIVRLVMTQSGRLVAFGAACGLIVSFSALAVLNAVIPLQHVSALDGGAFGAGVAIIALAAALATFFPSRRATRVDPSNALRAQG